jgi:hypothetical protein
MDNGHVLPIAVKTFFNAATVGTVYLIADAVI